MEKISLEAALEFANRILAIVNDKTKSSSDQFSEITPIVNTKVYAQHLILIVQWWSTSGLNHSDNIKVPNYIMNHSEEEKIELLNGLFVIFTLWKQELERMINE